MILIAASQLKKAYAGKACFEDVDLQIHSGQRIGLIGRNGVGKTSLFRVLCEEESYEGNLTRRRDLRIARIDQVPTFTPGVGVRDALMESVADIWQLENSIKAVHEQLGVEDLLPDQSARLLKKLATLEHSLEAEGGHDIERRIDAVLGGLGFFEDRFEQKVSSLSGGEQNRVALARLLLHEPDLWLLDEPTNHLDLDGIAFLERFLLQTQASMIIVSHDRRFLDRLTTDTWEIESCRLHRYPGNYSQSRAIRDERRLAAWRAYEKQRGMIAKTEGYVRRYGSGQRAKEARGRGKRLMRVQRLVQPEAQDRIMALNLPMIGRLGNRILELSNLEMGFGGSPLFQKLSLEWEPGETLGIVGPNGAGKTTLLQLLLGNLKPLAGEVRWGKTVQVGAMLQHDTFPDESLSPLSFLRTSGLGRSEQDLRDTLAAMLFRGGDVDRPVRFLSGGEKRRLMLTALLMSGHNVVLLDEPTNNLDVDSCEALEMALSAYEGNVLVISHDRYFLDQVADGILWIENSEWCITRGGFEEAATTRQKQIAEKTQAKNRGKQKSQRSRQPATAVAVADSATSPYAGWRTGRIEKRIIEIEERLEQIHGAMSDQRVYSDGERMKVLQQELNLLQEEQIALEEEYGTREI